jgi:hypothetical protein
MRLHPFLLAFLALVFSPFALGQAPVTAPPTVDHAPWTALLARHVRWVPQGPAVNGVGTVVDYAGFRRDRAALKRYTDTLARVPEATYARWSKRERYAFLINAYNAYTVALIADAPADLESIKDLGSLLQSPWKKAIFPLLGEIRSLDDIEHGLLRGADDFDEPRIHFAVNCASIGCPALRPEAYTGAKLDAQLQDQTRRFLKDRSRNRWNADDEVVEISSIFDWYSGDFEQGFLGADSVEAFLAVYAADLGLDARQAQALRKGELDLDYTDYDWRLNGVE